MRLISTAYPMPNGTRCRTTIPSPEYSSCLIEMSETQPHFSPADCEVGADCADGVRLAVCTQVSPPSPAQVSPDRVAPAQNHRATDGAWPVAGGDCQQGTLSLRKRNNLP